MSRTQFGFLAAVILVWLAAAQGWVVLAAVVAGLIVAAVVRLVEGDTDLNYWADRLRTPRTPKRS